MSETPLIQCRDLQKVYQLGKQNLHVLRGVDLAVQPGETVAIMGPSGSGKSTLLHLLGSLDIPSHGTIHYDGLLRFPVPRVWHPVQAWKRRRLRYDIARQIGFVFQSFHLIPELDLLENILMADRARTVLGRSRSGARQNALALANVLGIHERLKHQPRELSGGEQQRVAIARALINEPRLILADEPTGNLDLKTGGEILDVFFDLVAKQNSALIMVTHNPGIAERCDRVLHIHEGRLVANTANAKPPVAAAAPAPGLNLDKESTFGWNS